MVCIDTNPLTSVKNERFDLCIDTNTGVYRYIYQFLEILTDMYQIMQAWFDTSWCFWISERHRYVSIHASMIRYTCNYLPLRDHFCIDTSDRCIDTNCTKSVWSNFRTFVSIHMFMYRYIIPKNQFFKVLKIVFRCQVICNVAKICPTLFSCVLTIIKTWGWTGALTFSPFLIIVKTMHKLTKPIPIMQNKK